MQGVGYRNFAQTAAERLGVQGYTRNREDGTVEVYAIGNEAQLSELSGLLRSGPRWAEVHGVEEQDAPLESCAGFYIRP